MDFFGSACELADGLGDDLLALLGLFVLDIALGEEQEDGTTVLLGRVNFRF